MKCHSRPSSFLNVRCMTGDSRAILITFCLPGQTQELVTSCKWSDSYGKLCFACLHNSSKSIQYSTFCNFDDIKSTFFGCNISNQLLRYKKFEIYLCRKRTKFQFIQGLLFSVLFLLLNTFRNTYFNIQQFIFKIFIFNLNNFLISFDKI